jgi:hypothetical protein
LRGTKRINLFDGSLPEPLEAARPKVNHQTFGGQPSKAKVAIFAGGKGEVLLYFKKPFFSTFIKSF